MRTVAGIRVFLIPVKPSKIGIHPIDIRSVFPFLNG